MEQTQNADKTISVRQLKELMNTIEGNLTTWPANFRNRTNQLTVGKLPTGSQDEITKFYQEKFGTKATTKTIQRLASQKSASKISHNRYNKDNKEVNQTQFFIGRCWTYGTSHFLYFGVHNKAICIDHCSL